MEKPLNYFDLATGIFFFILLVKLAAIGLKELRKKGEGRFVERPDTWLQYSQPPLIFVMISLAYAGILTDHFRIGLPAPAGLLIRGTGMLMIAAGSALAYSAVRAIGKDMQTDIAVNKGHILRTRGAFAVVRHPMYLSLILIALGAGLSTLNLMLMGFAVLVLAPVQFLRAVKEEKLLSRHFGNEFTAYQKKTPMLFPCCFR